MQPDVVARGRRHGVAIVGLLAALLAACGTVLPPLEEIEGGSPGEDTGAPGDDAANESTMDDDSGPSDAAIDVSFEVTGDGCPDCTDVGIDSGARDAGGDPRGAGGDARDGDGRIVDGDGRAADGDVSSCPSPVDCALPACNGVSCGAHGLVCKSGMCACPGGQAKETTCSDKADNDCDGLTDCADPDCARLQCGGSTNQRCCGTSCVDTETDPANCQGCGLACAAGQACKRISDASGTRGHCTCAGTTSQCPKSPAQVCRVGNGDGQDNLCACDAVNHGNAGCAEGQVCVDVPAANFCRY